MKKSTQSLITSDGLNLHLCHWLPQADPKAIVLIVHGYGEHIARYEHVAEALVEAGYGVYGLDHRGHGKSEGERVYFDDFAQTVNDLNFYFEQIRHRYPEQRFFVYGHSMGSLISLLFALRQQHNLAGMIVSGTAVDGGENVPALLLAIGKFIARVAPKRRITPLTNEENALSRDPAVGIAYDNDPLVDIGGVRAGTALQMIQAGQRIKIQAKKLTLPILILHGGDDPLTPVSGSQYLYEHVRSKDKSLKIYPKMRHEVINEIDKEIVIADMVQWLDEH